MLAFSCIGRTVHQIWYRRQSDSVSLYLNFVVEQMTVSEHWRWTFRGFWATHEGKDVQNWFDRLPVEAQEEISDICRILAAATRNLWRKPEFDPLKGAGGISEIRPADVRLIEGSKSYRLYGYFGPGEHEYTVLLGVEKRQKNDREGKRIAKERLDRLEGGQATTHKLDLTPRDNSKIATQPRSQGKILGFDAKQGVGISTKEPSRKESLEPTRISKKD